MIDTKRAIMGLFIVIALVASGLAASQGVIMSSSSSSNIQHVIFIMMENKNYQLIIGSSSAPYINNLASTYALATNYYGAQYPSLPNYIDITSGSDGGITTDCSSGPASGGCETSNTNIFTLLQNNGLTWKAYEESMPSACYKSDYGTLSAGGYIVHHNPVPYYTDLSSVCSQNDVPLGDVSTKTGAFFTALDSNSLPSFSFVTPNSCDDMHNCGVSSGDSWLSLFIPDIINSPSYSTTVTIITWDTGDCSSPCNQTANGGGQVATLAIGPSNLVNYGKFSTFYNHYSTLATIEDIFNLGNLGRNDASATPMSAIININSISTSTSSTYSSSSSSSTSTKTTSSSSSTTSVSSTTTSETTTKTTSNTTATTSSSSSSTATSSNSTTASSSSNSSTSSSSQSFVSSSSIASSSSTESTSSVEVISSSSTSSVGNSSSSSQSNPIVGMLAALSPVKNPPVAYGLATYELCLFGALGYVLLGVRKGSKDGWRW